MTNDLLSEEPLSTDECLLIILIRQLKDTAIKRVIYNAFNEQCKPKHYGFAHICAILNNLQLNEFLLLKDLPRSPKTRGKVAKYYYVSNKGIKAFQSAMEETTSSDEALLLSQLFKPSVTNKAIPLDEAEMPLEALGLSVETDTPVSLPQALPEPVNASEGLLRIESSPVDENRERLEKKKRYQEINEQNDAYSEEIRLLGYIPLDESDPVIYCRPEENFIEKNKAFPFEDEDPYFLDRNGL